MRKSLLLASVVGLALAASGPAAGQSPGTVLPPGPPGGLPRGLPVPLPAGPLASPASPVAAPLDCPAGTTLAGARPPRGQEEWCERASGTRHGPTRLWYGFFGGAVKGEGEYRDGQRQGRWTFRDTSGRMRAEGEYRDGLREGPWTVPAVRPPGAGEGPDFEASQAWAFGGGLGQQQGEYRAGRRHGLWLTRNARGEVTEEVEYWEGMTLVPLRTRFPGAAKLIVTASASGHEHVCMKPGPDGQQLEDGRYTAWYLNGRKRAEGVYRDGRREGRWTAWDADGRKTEEVIHVGDRPVARTNTAPPAAARVDPDNLACPDGTVLAGATDTTIRRYQQWCQRRRPDGGWLEHGHYIVWEGTGALIEEGEYRDGHRDGRWTTWMGSQKTEGEYRNGQRSGRWTTWSLSSPQRVEKQLEEHYRDGRKQGLATQWGGSGKKSFEGAYRDGQRDGRWTFWDTGGWKQAERTFRADRFDGPFVTWHRDGSRESEGAYLDGKPHGRWRERDASGMPVAESE